MLMKDYQKQLIQNIKDTTWFLDNKKTLRMSDYAYSKMEERYNALLQELKYVNEFCEILEKGE